MMENMIDKMLMSLPYFDIDPDDDTIQVSDKGDYVPILSRVGSKWQLYWSDGEHYYFPVEEENTPTEAIQKAYDYCVEQGWIKKERK
jgi:hypothetical protein